MRGDDRIDVRRVISHIINQIDGGVFRREFVVNLTPSSSSADIPRGENQKMGIMKMMCNLLPPYYRYLLAYHIVRSSDLAPAFEGSIGQNVEFQNRLAE